MLVTLRVFTGVPVYCLLIAVRCFTTGEEVAEPLRDDTKTDVAAAEVFLALHAAAGHHLALLHNALQ